MKLEKEHFDIIDGLRAMDNLGESREVGPDFCCFIFSEEMMVMFPRSTSKPAARAESRAWQRQCMEAVGLDGAVWMWLFCAITN